jgi:hypothetical protein
MATTDAGDLLYAIESSRNYDPSAQLERITAPLRRRPAKRITRGSAQRSRDLRAPVVP